MPTDCIRERMSTLPGPGILPKCQFNVTISLIICKYISSLNNALFNHNYCLIVPISTYLELINELNSSTTCVFVQHRISPEE
jgi:hypothetical protein